MDLENIKSWVTQPDVCRCCLSANGTWDLTASYINNDVKEIFVDMLKECFGLTLTGLTEWGPSRLICQLCISHLRDATSFRKQVEEAEQQFINLCLNKKDFQEPDAIIKYEIIEENDNKSISEPEPKVTSDILQQSFTSQTKQLRKRKKRQKSSKNVKFSDDFDSDTPIASFTHNIEVMPIDNDALTLADKVDFENQDGDVELEDSLDAENFHSTDDIVNLNVQLNKTGLQRIKPQSRVKPLSEHKRVVLTCQSVLLSTTACPFRHHKSWFQCFYCAEEYIELNLLRNHTLNTHQNVENELKSMKRFPKSLQIDISHLQCLICSADLVNIDAMELHLKEHSKTVYKEFIADYKVNKSPYTCHLCMQEYHVFRSLTTHLNEHYANCICDVCGKSFINSKRLKVHKRTHEKGQFPCSECDKILNTKTSKSNHMESVHSKRVLKCQICSKPMKHYNDRIKHMSEFHNITHKFKCPICPREYNIKHYLATHIRQTHGNKNKKCSQCNMAFITNHGLKKHMLKHSGEKPFVCNICCKAYARNYTLKEHMRTHENEKSFLCTD